MVSATLGSSHAYDTRTREHLQFCCSASHVFPCFPVSSRILFRVARLCSEPPTIIKNLLPSNLRYQLGLWVLSSLYARP
jgi:hypothetical protein